MNNGRENFNSAISLWEDFLTQNPQNKLEEVPVSFYFCDNEKDANECAELVVNVIKQATATSLWLFKKYNEHMRRAVD